MLGRLRRTSRLDVGLALVFSGMAYLIWCLVAGTARTMVNQMRLAEQAAPTQIQLPEFTRVVKVFFVDTGFVIDLAGLIWMVLSLFLVVWSSRQKISVSWAWASAVSQVLVAALGGVLVGYAMNLPYRNFFQPGTVELQPQPLELLSQMSLPVILTVSILIWVTFLVWLLVEWARYRHRGPTLADGLRTNLSR